MRLEKGTKLLIDDLEVVLKDAKLGEFGDFTNRKYPAPKVELVSKLEEIKQNVINGKYDDNSFI